MSVHITVRDGRFGRDPALATEDGGEILNEYDAPQPLDVGDRITLPDGEEVEVIGIKERIGQDSWRQTVHVGNLFGTPPRI